MNFTPKFRAGFYFSAAAGCLLLLLLTDARAAPIYQFSTQETSSGNYDPDLVSITAESNLTAPADGTSLAAGSNGLARFWNSEWAGFTVSADNGTAIDDASEFDTGFWELTVSADPGFQLDLESLQFGSARGGSSGTRWYQLFAAVDGAGFTFGDTPIDSSPGGNETGTRGSPRPVTVDLSDSAYQGIGSITFRYYPLTPQTGNTMDFDGWTLNGEVIPEPSSLALLGLGLAGLLFAGRRRGRGGC